MNSQEKLTRLRQLMKETGIDFFVIPTSDPHMSEYVMDRFKSRVYMTNFTGSAGYAIVSEDEALLWADGRYHVQAAKQINGTPFELMKWGLDGVPTWQEWLKEHAKAGSTIGFNGFITSRAMYEEMQGFLKDVNYKFDRDLIGEFWENRPSFPSGKAFVLDKEFTGEVPTERLAKIRKQMADNGVSHMFVSTLDDICYTLNIRGYDDFFTPIVVSYMMVDAKDAVLFVKGDKLDDNVRKYLADNGVKIREYDDVVDALKSLSKKDIVWINASKTSALHYELISEGANVFNKALPTTMMKAVKNETELANTTKAHIIDGGALARYLFWIKKNVGKIELNEYSAQEKLHDFRKVGEGFISESFGTISAYRANAAMAHYSASADDHAEIKSADGIYLVDSGAQYKTGTTDVTRTITLGAPTREEIQDYTLTLKGHVDLFNAKFIKGTTGTQLDVLARGSMWKYGIDFKHGTGHGVGFVLGVHEGPHSISRAMSVNVPLVPGMVVSNEPGIYREGKHGIRIENLVYVKPFTSNEFGEFYQFENLTYCPYERELIDKSMLTDEEINYVDEYHKKTLELLLPFMKTEEEVEWLKASTRPL